MADLLPITIKGKYRMESTGYNIRQRIYWNGWQQHKRNRNMVRRLLTIKKHITCQ